MIKIIKLNAIVIWYILYNSVRLFKTIKANQVNVKKYLLFFFTENSVLRLSLFRALLLKGN